MLTELEALNAPNDKLSCRAAPGCIILYHFEQTAADGP